MIQVRLGSQDVLANVRRVGPIQANGWSMLTLDLPDGSIGYSPAKEHELDPTAVSARESHLGRT